MKYSIVFVLYIAALMVSTAIAEESFDRALDFHIVTSPNNCPCVKAAPKKHKPRKKAPKKEIVKEVVVEKVVEKEVVVEKVVTRDAPKNSISLMPGRLSGDLDIYRTSATTAVAKTSNQWDLGVMYQRNISDNKYRLSIMGTLSSSIYAGFGVNF